jgi:hypothetical protein
MSVVVIVGVVLVCFLLGSVGLAFFVGSFIRQADRAEEAV